MPCIRSRIGWPLIIPLIIQTIRLDASGAVWTDKPSNVSRPDPIGAYWADAEHPSRNRKVGEACPAWLRHGGRDQGTVVVSFAVAARLLPSGRIWDGAGPARATRQVGDQGCCGVEVRGFEPLASSVRGIELTFPHRSDSALSSTGSTVFLLL